MKKIYNINEIKELLYPIFKSNAVYKAILFGSYARREATENSDIDIAIDSKGELLNIKFYGLLEDIVEKLNKKVDLIEMSEIKKDSHIYNEIQKEGITIFEHQS